MRVKDVAAEARLSPGLVSYYFASIDDLLVDVHQDAVTRFYWSRVDAVNAVADPRDKMREMIRQGIPDTDSGVLSIVLYELHLHAARNRSHAALMTALFDREVSLYDSVLQVGSAQGVFRPIAPIREIAFNAVALEDAYGLHIVCRNASLTVERSRQLVSGFLSRMLDCELDPEAEPDGGPTQAG